MIRSFVIRRRANGNRSHGLRTPVAGITSEKLMRLAGPDAAVDDTPALVCSSSAIYCRRLSRVRTARRYACSVNDDEHSPWRRDRLYKRGDCYFSYGDGNALITAQTSLGAPSPSAGRERRAATDCGFRRNAFRAENTRRVRPERRGPGYGRHGALVAGEKIPGRGADDLDGRAQTRISKFGGAWNVFNLFIFSSVTDG